MPSASAIRQQIEAALAERIPSALTPEPRMIRPVIPTGVRSIDEVLGGLPVAVITEMAGAECSGRTGLALSFLAQVTTAGKVCAWIDVSDCLQPESTAGMGVNLDRLLWVRCGVTEQGKREERIAPAAQLPERYFVPPPVTKGLHGGGFGPHPRTEMKGMQEAIGGFLDSEATGTGHVELQQINATRAVVHPALLSRHERRGSSRASKPWSRMEQGLRVTDLLLQAGGFSAIVLDMGSIAPEFAARVPLATWFRYRAAAERSQTSILLLTQATCAKSSAGLVLRFETGRALQEERTVLAGLEYHVAVDRERFAPALANVVPMRKPPQGVRAAGWRSRAIWAGGR